MIKKIKLSESFNEFFKNEISAGTMLIICSALSLILANSVFSESYLGFWKIYIGGMTISYWVNDGLIAIFFLLIGLELKRELYKGELSSFKNALLPIVAASGGIILPALIHYSFNAGLPTQRGIGIPMATDIAFALSILALAGSRVPAALKIFLTAIAVIDDLFAIIIIAIFYSSKLSTSFFAFSLAVFGVLMIFNRLRIKSLIPYLLGGVLMWFFMLQSGIHATIAGVLLAFTIPFTPFRDDKKSPSYILENFLHKPVAFFILPIFAMANTGIVISANWTVGLTSPNSLGIISGLLFGKVLGVTILGFAAVKLGICRLPLSLSWKHVIGAGFLAGIGFTMSIFITNLAFKSDPVLINESIMTVLFASLISGIFGYLWLILFTESSSDIESLDTMSYDND